MSSLYEESMNNLVTSLAKKSRTKKNKVRIIAGRLKGRQLSFPDQPGLRPTGDRLRETLFSWLQPSLPESYCLDMFAGSGALGIEAASRGAASVILLEQSAIICKHLNASIDTLALENVSVKCADATRVDTLRGLSVTPFNIVFIDPPFVDQLQGEAVMALQSAAIVADNALISVETDKRTVPGDFPPNWELLKEKLAGEVRLQLFRAANQ